MWRWIAFQVLGGAVLAAAIVIVVYLIHNPLIQ